MNHNLLLLWTAGFVSLYASESTETPTLVRPTPATQQLQLLRASFRYTTHGPVPVNQGPKDFKHRIECPGFKCPGCANALPK